MNFISCAILVFTSSFYACTDLIVTKKASANGHNMFTYAADSGTLYGELYHQPAAQHAPGDKRPIYNWDTGAFLCEIDEVEKTYNVIGNMNEHGLCIGESTFSGRPRPTPVSTGIDYGSLIYVTLQRCITAREAITCMDELTKKYGYASTGESFTIADEDEIWVMEMHHEFEVVDGKAGCQWAAVLIPDGCVSGHANQARIQRLFYDYNDTLIKHSDGVYTYALNHEWTNDTEADFNFAGTYGSANGWEFGGRRFCDGRVWSFYNRIGLEVAQYENYALGRVPIEKGVCEPFPLYFELKTAAGDLPRITRRQLMDCMGDHFEGTKMDMTTDVGAGPRLWANRYGPLYWDFNDTEGETHHYFNERPIGTPQTGWSIVGEMRPLTTGAGPILWFGLDDCYTSVYMPFFPSITSVARCLRGRMTGELVCSMNEFSMDSLFWVTNMVANFGYTDAQHIQPEILARIHDYHEYFESAVAIADEEVAEMGDADPAAVTAYKTRLCTHWAEKIRYEWLELYKDLFVRWMDLHHKYVRPGQRDPGVTDHRYPAKWYDYIVQFTGKKYKKDQK